MNKPLLVRLRARRKSHYQLRHHPAAMLRLVNRTAVALHVETCASQRHGVSTEYAGVLVCLTDRVPRLLCRGHDFGGIGTMVDVVDTLSAQRTATEQRVAECAIHLPKHLYMTIHARGVGATDKPIGAWEVDSDTCLLVDAARKM